MDRYDNIEYSFEDTPPPSDSDVQVTQKDGFITSQHYSSDLTDKALNTETDENITEEEPNGKKEKKDKNTQRELVVVCQLVICILIAITAYIIKSFGGDTYEKARDFYYNNLNNSLIIDFEKDSNDQAVRDITNDIIAEQN